MSSQVLLDPVELSVLSIPRDKVWLFNSPILQLLHGEAKNVPDYDSDLEVEYSSLDTEDEYLSSDDGDSIDDQDPMILSHHSSGSGLKLNMSQIVSETKVDNTSKKEIASSSSDSFADLTSLSKNHSRHDDFEDERGDHFFHIAFTPTECTVICSTTKFSSIFKDALNICLQLHYNDVILLPETYLNLQVDSEGHFNNSAKILELTRPLSENMISLFFLSSHYSNIVLIPHHFKDEVKNILTRHKFQFTDLSEDSQTEKIQKTDLESDLTENLENFSVHDIESKTLSLFKSAGIQPIMNKKVKLLLTSARRGESKTSILKAAQCIASNDIPDYFAITKISNTSISLILPGSSRKRAALGFDYKRIIGSSQETIIPITIDLTNLPLDSTGIVAGMASRLLTSMKSVPDYMNSTFEMNYLSMARSAIILIPKENLKAVSKMLEHMDTRDEKNITETLSRFEM